MTERLHFNYLKISHCIYIYTLNLYIKHTKCKPPYPHLNKDLSIYLNRINSNFLWLTGLKNIYTSDIFILPNLIQKATENLKNMY